jgi:hypothetical protein
MSALEEHPPFSAGPNCRGLDEGEQGHAHVRQPVRGGQVALRLGREDDDIQIGPGVGRMVRPRPGSDDACGPDIGARGRPGDQPLLNLLHSARCHAHDALLMRPCSVLAYTEKDMPKRMER